MIFNTNDGRTVSVGLSHPFINHPRRRGERVRQTVMWLHSTTRKGVPFSVEASVTCSLNDNFSKAAGRKLVRMRFMPSFEKDRLDPVTNQWLPAYKYEFDREDRRRIYEHLLPEYRSKKSKRFDHHKVRLHLEPDNHNIVDSVASNVDDGVMTKVQWEALRDLANYHVNHDNKPRAIRKDLISQGES